MTFLIYFGRAVTVFVLDMHNHNRGAITRNGAGRTRTGRTNTGTITGTGRTRTGRTNRSTRIGTGGTRTERTTRGTRTEELGFQKDAIM